MDATRARRTRDQARQGWYARYRQRRFARYLGFVGGSEAQLTAAAVLLSFKAGTTISLRLDLAPGGSSAPTSDRYPHSLAVAAQ